MFLEEEAKCEGAIGCDWVEVAWNRPIQQEGMVDVLGGSVISVLRRAIRVGRGLLLAPGVVGKAVTLGPTSYGWPLRQLAMASLPRSLYIYLHPALHNSFRLSLKRLPSSPLIGPSKHPSGCFVVGYFDQLRILSIEYERHASSSSTCSTKSLP
ncbi:MAG: hypothetical protein KTR25_12180 [Myxococcales bacterium]|nr:hypothetical protein [Myxococcales bacterium]